MTAPWKCDKISFVTDIRFATVAQLVEQLTRNEQVACSNQVSSSRSEPLKSGFTPSFSGVFLFASASAFCTDSALITLVFLKEILLCKSDASQKSCLNTNRTLSSPFARLHLLIVQVCEPCASSARPPCQPQADIILPHIAFSLFSAVSCAILVLEDTSCASARLHRTAFGSSVGVSSFLLHSHCCLASHSFRTFSTPHGHAWRSTSAYSCAPSALSPAFFHVDLSIPLWYSCVRDPTHAAAGAFRHRGLRRRSQWGFW